MAQPATRPVLRGAASGGACALLAGWLMTQSKGGLVALAVSGVVFFTLSRKRLRALVPTLIPASFVAASYVPLTRPFRERDAADFAEAIRSGSGLALVLVAAAALAGVAYALVGRRASIPERAQRAVGAGLLAALGAAVIGASATFFVVVDRPGHFLQEKWTSFKTLPAHESGSSHLTSLGSNRYDFWRVELNDFKREPLAGVGAPGFAASQH